MVNVVTHGVPDLALSQQFPHSFYVGGHEPVGVPRSAVQEVQVTGCINKGGVGQLHLVMGSTIVNFIGKSKRANTNDWRMKLSREKDARLSTDSFRH